MIINEQLKIIAEINAIINSKPEGYDPEFDLEIWALCNDLEKLGTQPLLNEIERFRIMYLEAASRNIPNLNDIQAPYEHKH